jgi:hypothetical protein
VNIINEQFRLPLIGFVNVAKGSHAMPQAGFVNFNQNNFSSVQAGFINTAGGDMSGLQMGFINTTVKSLNGVQFGFVNTAAGESARGLQMGFVNTAINGYAGAQISFLNVAKKINGLQLGFINYAESIEKGIPVGFISIVRNGGYRAVETGVSGLSPFNISFKIGVERFYTSFIVSYNPFKDDVLDQIMWGAGFGTIVQLGKTFFFNPELITLNKGELNKGNESFQNYVSFIPYFGYNLFSNLSIVAGPSLVWAYNNKSIIPPFYSIIEYPINDNNKLYLEARIGVRFRW